MLVVAVTALAACRDSSSEPPASPPAPTAAQPSVPPAGRADAATEAPASLEQPVRRTLPVGALHRYRLTLGAGESCNVVVTQDGVDVVVEAFAPDHARIARVDSPNGRHGDEPLELHAAAAGAYEITVGPIDRSEPVGDYEIKLAARRDAAATRQLLEERAQARRDAAAWLHTHAGAIRLAAAGVEGPGLARFDALAQRSRVLGLGEATHGSRQFADLRLALTRRAIERHGVRVVGLEASAARMRNIDRWTRRADADAAGLEPLIGGFWINRRAFLALAGVVRTWNLAHPRDPVALIGLDDQDNAPARDALARFAARAYAPEVAAQLREVLARIAKADAQASVFGPSDVSADDWRRLVHAAGLLEARRPVLAARFGAAELDDVIAAAWTLARFAEINAGVRDEPTSSRDWMMAAGLLRALGPTTRAVYWGHNAHVKHPAEARGDRAPAGGLLAEALGPGYAAIAIAFLEGGFLAQLPNDPQDRLQSFAIPAAADDSIDGVLASIGLGDLLAAWPSGRNDAPPWLLSPRLMHWIGGLYAADSLPGEQSRPMQLVTDFDGVAFLAHVDAEASTEIGKNRAP